MALDYAVAVNAEIKDLFAGGADVVQIDEPYMQGAAGFGAPIRAHGAQPRARRRHRHHRGTHLLRLRAHDQEQGAGVRLSGGA
ncbi:MAG: hypothetical protein WDN48_00185 [Pseudolabrys sp.]